MDALIKRRSTLKGSFTRLETFIESISAAVQDAVIPTRAQLQARSNLLEQYWTQFGEIQQQIDDLCETEDERKAEEATTSSFETRYIDIKAFFIERLGSSINATTPTRPTSNEAPSS